MMMKIYEAAARLDVPPEHLYLSAFLAQKHEVQERSAELLRELKRLRSEAYGAAVRILAEGCPQSTPRNYFERLKLSHNTNPQSKE